MESSGEPAGQVKTPNKNEAKKTKGKDKKTKGHHHKKGLMGDIKGMFVSSSSSEASLAGLNAEMVHKLYDPKDLELQEDKGRRYSHRALHYLADKLNDADLCFMTMKPRGLPTDCTIKGNYVTVCRQNAILGPKNSEIEKVRLPVLKPEKTQSDEDNLILLPGQSKCEATKLLVNRDNPEEFAEYLNTKVAWDNVRPDSPDSSEEERLKKLKKEQRRLAKERETRDAQYFSDLQHLGDDDLSSGETDKEVPEEVTQEEEPPMVEENQNAEEAIQEENPENPEEVVVENPEGENPEPPESEVVENPEEVKVENPEEEPSGRAIGRSLEDPDEDVVEGVDGEKTVGGEEEENKEEPAIEEGDKPPEEGEIPPAEGDKPPEEGDVPPSEAEKPPEEGEDVDKGGAGDDADGLVDGIVVAEGEEGEKQEEVPNEEETKEGEELAEPETEAEPEGEEEPENAEEEQEEADENNSWLGYEESDYTVNDSKKDKEKEDEEPQQPQMNRGPMMDPMMMGGMGMGMGGMGMGMGMGMNPMMYHMMNQMMMLTAMTTMSSMVSSLRPPPPPPPCCYPCCGPCDPCGYDPCGYDNCCGPCPYYDCCGPSMMPTMPCDYSFKKKCCKKSKCKKKKSKCHKRKTKDRKSGQSEDTRSSKRTSDRTHRKTNSSICSGEVHPHKPPQNEEDMSFDFLPQKNCCAEVTMIMEPEEPNPLMYSIANGAMPVICCDMPQTLMMDQPYGYC